MKFLTPLIHLIKKYRFLKNSNNSVRLLLPSLLIFVGSSLAVIFMGPYIVFGDYAPLASLTSRLQCVVSFFLLWIMKLLLIDLAHPFFAWRASPTIKNTWMTLDAHLHHACQFLQNTFFVGQGKKERLTSLPWFLLLGPHHVGKTTLLSQAAVNYILQKKTKGKSLGIAQSVQFWATKQAVFVEIQGNELGFSLLQDGNREARTLHDSTWRYFFYWLTKNRRHAALQGIMLLLPYTMFTLSDKAKRHAAKRLIERLSVVSSNGNPLPLYIVVTHCDRMSGFLSYFHELPKEESEQLFGMQLTKETLPENVLAEVKYQYDRLIKQVNQQLIYKLHHEQRSGIKPFIKAFPLQLEELKRNMLSFLKYLQPAFSLCQIEGIFLSSATQTTQHTVLNDAQTLNETGVTIYREDLFSERPYFVKALFTQLPHIVRKVNQQPVNRFIDKIRLHYVLPIMAVLLVGGFFCYDFMRGVTIERTLHQVQLAQMQTTTITLSQKALNDLFGQLHALKKIQKENHASLEKGFFVFYTKRALAHVDHVIAETTYRYLLPVLHKNLEVALSRFINYEPHTAYAILKSYLMLSGQVEMDTPYLYHALLAIEPFHSNKILATALNEQLKNTAFVSRRFGLPVDSMMVQTARQYFWALSREKLGFVILLNQGSYFLPLTLPFQHNTTGSLVTDHYFYVPTLFSAANLTNVLTKDSLQAVKESLYGNVVLGIQRNTQDLAEQEALLVSNVRNLYVQAYANRWEQLLTHVGLRPSHNLIEWENRLLQFHETNSAFLRFVYDNTYFEPITSISARLKSLDSLLDQGKQESRHLFLIQKSLTDVSHYVKPVLLSQDPSKTAFELTVKRMQDQNDPLTQLHRVADQSPEPLKSWLQQMANQLWAHLMKEASHYIDLAWQEKISDFFLTHFLNRYPFDSRAIDEVPLEKFKLFFSSKGHLIQFYQAYLDPFIDYEDKIWRWKTVDDKKLAFSEDVLKQIQLGLRIHAAFFPNGSDDISLQFSLAARQWGDQIKQVMIDVNNQKIVDNTLKKGRHLLEWPGRSEHPVSSVRFTLNDNKNLKQQYLGEWALFRLVDASFDTVLSKNDLLLDLSSEEYPVKYVISTSEPISPFSTVKLAYFKLPKKLI